LFNPHFAAQDAIDVALGHAFQMLEQKIVDALRFATFVIVRKVTESLLKPFILLILRPLARFGSGKFGMNFPAIKDFGKATRTAPPPFQPQPVNIAHRNQQR